MQLFGTVIYAEERLCVMMTENENDVILAVLKLSRALRRCPPPPMEHPFPPAVGRFLACVADHPQVSSRDLCELLDLRPSSLSEILTRSESEGLITRAVDEEDRRMQRVSLSPKGAELVARLRESREADLRKKTACFTEEEKAQFCALSNKLSEHLESLASDVPEQFRCPPHGPHHGPGPGPGPRPPFPPEGRLRC